MPLPKCFCPKNSQDIYDGKLLNEDVERCGKPSQYRLDTPDLLIDGKPVCKFHLMFFALHGMAAKPTREKKKEV